MTTTEYGSLRERIAAEKAERLARYDAFERVWNGAVLAGSIAAKTCTPEPMIVQDMQTGFVYEPVMDGVCGFAWVTVRPGNCSFARWLVKTGRGRSSYGGGVQVWISDYRQSYERKSAHAAAMAAYLRDSGLFDSKVRITSGGRLD